MDAASSTVSISCPSDFIAHRPPFLFVDRVVIDRGAARASSWRRFDEGEGFFRGHFPGGPIVPGVILLEQAAQTANILASHRAGRPLLAYLAHVTVAAFNAPVRPPATVVVDVRFARDDLAAPGGGASGIIAFKALGSCGGTRCFRAGISLFCAN